MRVASLLPAVKRAHVDLVAGLVAQDTPAIEVVDDTLVEAGEVLTVQRDVMVDVVEFRLDRGDLEHPAEETAPLLHAVHEEQDGVEVGGVALRHLLEIVEARLEEGARGLVRGLHRAGGAGRLGGELELLREGGVLAEFLHRGDWSGEAQDDVWSEAHGAFLWVEAHGGV
jgi:hypothetical protein